MKPEVLDHGGRYPDVSALPPDIGRFVRRNVDKAEEVWNLSDSELVSRLSHALLPLERVNPLKTVLLFVYCMDERCSTLDALSSCALANVDPQSVSDGECAILKVRLPPFFAGRDASEEKRRLALAGRSMAGRVRAIREANPDVEIRIIPTVHEGCGGGQALFSKGYYDVPDIDAAVTEHWKGLHRAMEEVLGQTEKAPPFEIIPLPLGNMRPSIDVHYADMALVAVIDPALTLRIGPLIASDLFPRTYQISGDYLVDEPEAIGQIAALAVDISSGKHALPGLVTPERPFRYILLGNRSTASAIARVAQELDTALRHSGGTGAAVRICIV